MTDLLEFKPLQVGDQLPAFDLITKDQQRITNQDFANKHWLVYFYPKANTPGCTLQAKSLHDHLPVIPVVVVSADKCGALQNFAAKYQLQFILASDDNHKFAKACGVFAAKSFMGINKNRIYRVAFLVDPQGKIIEVFYGFKTDQFAQVVNTKLNELQIN